MKDIVTENRRLGHQWWLDHPMTLLVNADVSAALGQHCFMATWPHRTSHSAAQLFWARKLLRTNHGTSQLLRLEQPDHMCQDRISPCRSRVFGLNVMLSQVPDSYRAVLTQFFSCLSLQDSGVSNCKNCSVRARARDFAELLRWP